MKVASSSALLVLVVLTAPCQVAAQKTHRIAALVAEDQFVPAIEGFKKRMGELGYIEGKNVKYEFHNAKGDIEALKELAGKIVQQKPDLIVTSSTTATVPVAKATAGTDLPVVFLSAGNPLKLVKSYASSGNNLTGISSSILDLTEKRMQLFKELSAAVHRVISIYNPKGPNYEEYAKSSREAAKRMGFALSEVEVAAANPEAAKKPISLITRKLGDAIMVPPDASVVSATEHIAQQALKEKLPTVGPNVRTVGRGLLIAYSSDYYALGEQGAVLVEKILRGARPTDLPIEQPFKLKLVINLKTARAIDLKIPRELLLRADEVIE
ncbi:MAG TPA: ABC transporter substrate-binding protein [Candidatus Acidoferrales bacterium]|nr:ABC transporter substrate-binding protein [Candidatus Acidoferrales bacterium]